MILNVTITNFFSLEKKAINLIFISSKICLGAQKNCLIETVLWSTHNMFWLSSKKNKCLLSGGLGTGG